MANHYPALLTHSHPSHSVFLTAVPGQTPPLLLNNMCRLPFVLQAAGRLLFHTFSPGELKGKAREGERALDTFETLESVILIVQSLSNSFQQRHEPTSENCFFLLFFFFS